MFTDQGLLLLCLLFPLLKYRATSSDIYQNACCENNFQNQHIGSCFVSVSNGSCWVQVWCPDHKASSKPRTIALSNQLPYGWFKLSDSGLFWLHWVMECQHRSVVTPDPFGLLSLLNKMNCISLVYVEKGFILYYALVFIMKTEKPFDFSPSNLQTLPGTIILFHCRQ